MIQGVDIKIAQHKALSDLSMQYNRINWILHSIFIPLNGGLLVWLLTMLKKENVIACIIIVIASGGGALLVVAWRKIFRRHGEMINVLYKELHSVENEIVKLAIKGVTSFDVHLLFDKLDKPIATHPLNYKIPEKTHKIIHRIQRVLLGLYVVIALIALVYQGAVSYFA